MQARDDLLPRIATLLETDPAKAVVVEDLGNVLAHIIAVDAIATRREFLGPPGAFLYRPGAAVEARRQGVVLRCSHQEFALPIAGGNDDASRGGTHVARCRRRRQVQCGERRGRIGPRDTDEAVLLSVFLDGDPRKPRILRQVRSRARRDATTQAENGVLLGYLQHHDIREHAALGGTVGAAYGALRAEVAEITGELTLQETRDVGTAQVQERFTLEKRIAGCHAMFLRYCCVMVCCDGR
jgi:hypothetical protein